MIKDESKAAPRRGGRPSREEAEKLEDKILDAAAALFFDEGYGAVSVEEIAKQAQISKRTFYARFENKAAIFRAAAIAFGTDSAASFSSNRDCRCRLLDST